MSGSIKITCNDLEKLVMESIGKILIAEALSSKIYHFTTIKSAFDIVKSNEMFCQSALAGSADNLDERYKFYISFTRSKSPLEGFGYGRSRCMSTARIEFDGEKLSHNFRGKAVNYWNSDVLMNKHNYMKRALTDKAYGYVPYEGDEIPSNLPSMLPTMLKWANETSPEYVKSNGKVYVKRRVIPDDVKHHQDNEIEDRLFTNKSVIDGVGRYITRIDILVDRHSEMNDIKYAKMMSHMKRVFVYDNMNDFAAQSDNTINEWLLSSSDVSTSVEVDMLNPSYTVQLLTSFLELITLDIPNIENKFKHAARILDENGLGSYKRRVFKKWDRWGTNLKNAIDLTNTYMSNVSKDPSKDGQKALALISKWMTKHGYSSFRDMYNKLASNDSNKISVDKETKKEFTILELNWTKYDVTNQSSVDVWYILGANDSIMERYTFFENVVYVMEQNGLIDKVKGGYDKFLKYCKNLAHKKLSLAEINSIFGKIGIDFYDLLDMYGITYNVEQSNLDYYEFTAESINAPFPPKDGEWTYIQRYDYAAQVFKK